ncbi:MAG: 3-dehydroquinate synthase, 3-dehydroquinate synthase [Candidatus Peregrinibacteria bacterium GW2011_GWE2_39_6]|nr:MAG: 3-dehydroquinate synthase, 3-dehydroquinate synthase [Candidatus Peregrinibacteria bacterium GW2011_GWF2_39_17]KKR25496.1 MAG: 3-dehydroquinate synthase, 3-dehydroquinate synthase [Candidatus Peregrinibacteria bacterium GW2011_GWE2_39_6]HCW31905.1 3-dehydroquinate synthase [Candidatus Peregrinibacteria bacterium]
MKIISLKLKKKINNSYDLFIEPGLFSQIAGDIAKQVLATKYCLITDTNLRKLYGEELQGAMRKLNMQTTLLSFQAGEKNKNLATVEKLVGQMVQLGHNRQSCIIALGGGVVGDVAGFVASIYMRGISFIQIPTTLLAMCDASIGGKTGVDLLLGKNLIGSFIQPKRVYIDPQLLSTLSKRQIRNGLAEIVKHGLLADKKILKILRKFPEKALDGHTTTITELLVRSCKVKAKIVQNDEQENNLRMLLNYGHSIGHAIEHASGYRLNHGEAVAIGMNLENCLARERNLLAQKHQQRIEELLKTLHLPTKLPGSIDRQPIIQALKHDKKNSALNTYTFTLLKRPGRPIVVNDVTENEVQSVLLRF